MSEIKRIVKDLNAVFIKSTKTVIILIIISFSTHEIRIYSQNYYTSSGI